MSVREGDLVQVTITGPVGAAGDDSFSILSPNNEDRASWIFLDDNVTVTVTTPQLQEGDSVTSADLASLPVGTSIETPEGVVQVKQYDGRWWAPATGVALPAASIQSPRTIAFLPGQGRP